MNKRLSLHSADELETVDDFKSVVSLEVSSVLDLTKFEYYLRKCVNLEILHMSGVLFASHIPEVVFSLTKLHTLIIKNCSINYISPSISKLEALKTLALNSLYLLEFPSAIGYLSKLEELNLMNTKFKNNLEDLGDLKELRHLNVYKTGIKRLSKVIYSLPKLRELLVPKKIYNEILKKNPIFEQQLSYLFESTPLEKKYISSLLNLLKRNNYSLEFRAILMNLLAGNYNKIDQFASINEILAATDVKSIEVIRLKALEYYEQKWGKNYSNRLGSHAHIAVMGKLGINKKELQKKLKNQGIKYSAKISLKTTYLLLGQLSHGAYLEALERKIPIVTEQIVVNFINDHTEQYLVDDADTSEEYAENISNLLLSGQEDNIALALELFKDGGFPKELLTELFIAYRQTTSVTVQKEAERLLRQYGSVALIDFIKKKDFLFYEYGSENSLITKLNKLEKNTELNTLKIAWYGYRHHQKGLCFLLKKLPSNAKLQLLQELKKGDSLDLSSLGLTSIPKEVFELTTLASLNLRYNRISTIPVKLLQKLVELRELNLTGNYKLWTKKNVDNSYGDLAKINADQQSILTNKLVLILPNLNVKLNR
jgi:Leucine-rich repeat (LRR) protein